MTVKCSNCGWYGDEDELEIEHTCYEDYYGAPVSGFTPLDLPKCPRCGDYDVYESDEDENNEDNG